MAYVRISEDTEYGTPYTSIQAMHDRARESMAYAVECLARREALQERREIDAARTAREGA